MVVTISTGVQGQEELNTAYLTQQLLTAPGKPNTIAPEVDGKEILIGWTDAKFDGGSRISGYTVQINGSQICYEDPQLEEPVEGCAYFPTPQPIVFQGSYATTYEVSVAAVNDIGIGAFISDVVTTIDDPTPPAIGGYAYPGPILKKFTPSTVSTGQIVTVLGDRLDLITAMEIGGKAVEFVLENSTTLRLKVPFDLADAIYDVVVSSSYGKLTVQDALRVMGAPLNEDLIKNPTDDTTEPEISEPGENPEEVDTDRDGQNNNVDSDIDGDGIPNGLDNDLDGDGINNGKDPNPSIPNAPEDELDNERPTNGEEPQPEISQPESPNSEVANTIEQQFKSLAPVSVLLLILIVAALLLWRRARAKSGVGDDNTLVD